jgi:GNAT superfamily N-acetyltransferase
VRGLRILERTDPTFTLMCDALVAAGVPTSDLFDGDAHYFAAKDHGFGGFVRIGDIALLRSIVIAKDRRGQGSGTIILDGLIAQLRALGVSGAWLLTTAADNFFAKHGFARRPRTDAPAAIAATAQFRELCPDTAVLMHRALS